MWHPWGDRSPEKGAISWKEVYVKLIRLSI